MHELLTLATPAAISARVFQVHRVCECVVEREHVRLRPKIRVAHHASIISSVFGWDTDPVKGVCCWAGPRWLVIMVFIALVCSLLPVFAFAAEPAGVKVTTIEIRGNKRIELPAILGRLTLKPGDPYTPENVRGQIKILYETGYFEEVQVETEAGTGGTALAFLVREKPFITEIVFDGNTELSDEIGRAHV